MNLLNLFRARRPAPPLSRKPLKGQNTLGLACQAAVEASVARAWAECERAWEEREKLPDAVEYDPHLVKRQILGKLETAFNADSQK